MLRDVQRQFMRGVLDSGAVPGVLPMAAMSIYVNNARVSFAQTLKLAYPAIWRLVGEDYFLQCAREFQKLNPSRSGDLQQVGEGFSGYLAKLHSDDEFSYLADVARLEWAYQEALVESEAPPLDLSRLAQVEPQYYLDLRFRLQPSTRLLGSPFPILAIWQANVANEPGEELIDLTAGADRLLVVRAFGGVRIHGLTPGEFAFLTRLLAQDAFGLAVEVASATDKSFDAGNSLKKFVAFRALVDFYL